MPDRIVNFNGVRHVFPGDATDDEVRQALDSHAKGKAPVEPAPAQPAPVTQFEMERGAGGVTQPFDVPTPGLTGKQTIKPPARGFLPNLAGDIKGMFSNIPTVTSPYPGMDMERKQQVAQQSLAEDEARKQAGYGTAYRTIAPVGEALGANVSGMEQSAQAADPWGVAGHFAAVPAVLAATEATKAGLGKAVAAPEEIAAYARRAKSLNDATKAGAGVYQGEVQPPIQKLQAAIADEGHRTIQGLLAADKADASVKGTGSISTAKTATAAAKALEETGYEPRGAERDILEKLTADPTDKIAQGLGYQNADMARARLGETVWESTVQKIRGSIPELGPGGLTMDEAVKLRTAVGNALYRKTIAPKFARVLGASYTELTNAIAARAEELGGAEGTKAWNHYNNEFTAWNELKKGITGDMLQSLEDRHDSIPKLKQLSGADLTEVKEMMKKYGLDPGELDKAQSDAKSVVDFHEDATRKQGKSLMRMVEAGGAAGGFGLGTYMLAKGAGLYGFAPYLLATYLGNKAVGDAGSAMEVGRILRKLGHDPDSFQVRTPVEGPMKFNINPDEQYGTAKPVGADVYKGNYPQSDMFTPADKARLLKEARTNRQSRR